MKTILKTTESYQVSKWIGKSGKETYAVIFFDEMRYLKDEINGRLMLNKKFIEKPSCQCKSRILQPYDKVKQYL